MIGLLQKDFFILWHAYKKNLLLILALYTGMALLLEMNFMLFFLCWVMGFYVVGAISIDNYSKWDLYAACLPVKKGQIVGAKFILILLGMAAGLAYSTVMAGVLYLVHGLSFVENVFTALVTVLISLVYFGVTLVLSYKFGVEKARTGMLLLVGLGAGGIMVLFNQDALSSGALSGLAAALEARPVFWFCILVLVSAAVYLGCWAISTMLYGKKEF